MKIINDFSAFRSSTLSSKKNKIIIGIRPLAQLQRKPSVLINSNSLSMVSQQTLASIVF